MKKISFLFCAFLAGFLANGQTFTNVISGSGIPVDRTILWGFIDYNADGFEDLLASTGTGNPFVLKLFKNNGNSTFSDVSANVGLPEIDSIRFGRVADFNKDGKQDFMLIDINNNLQVFCASNSGTFENKTIASGISLSGSSSPEGFQIVDFNKDGFPDLSFYRSLTGGAKEIVCNINGFSGSGNSTSAILPPFATDITPQFQFSDFDNDRDLDLLVQTVQTYPFPGASYYYHPVKVYGNQNGTFTEVPNVVPISVSTDYLIETDFDQDGYFDFIGGTSDNVFNGTPIVPILKNSGNGTFINSSSNPNFHNGTWYYSTFSEVDFDQDGDIDYYSPVDYASGNGSRFWVNENGNFTEQSSSLGIRLSSGNGGSPRAGWFDLDNDGDLDCFGNADIGGLTQTSLAKNNQTGSNKWIKVILKGCQSGTDAFYSKIMIRSGSNRYHRLKSPFQGNIPQSQLIHFGLGNASTIDSVVVKWPSGQTTILTNVAANQTLTVNEDNNCDGVSANCPDLSGSLLQGLVGYWPFCGNANDESGNGNNGTVNGATLTTDRFGNAGSAYDFNSGNSIVLPNGSNIQGNNPRSISFWMKPEITNTATYTIYKGGTNGNGNDFTIWLRKNIGNTYQLYVRRFVDDVLTDSLPINLNWGHYSIVYDGTVNSNIKFFINGIEHTGRALAGSGLTFNTAATQPEFGHNIDQLGVHRYFDGIMDDIAIWNRALGQNEITQLYNQGICQTSITVTDTLLIHTGITSYNPVSYGNTLKVWPNPGNQDITLDAGNLSSMQGWKYKVANTLGQTVVNETAINQQQTMIDLSNWGGNGIYYLHLINPQGHAIEIKKIVLAP